MKQVTVIAHRGNFLPEGPIPTIRRYKIPENTLVAFERAFQRGFGIETDIRQTKDNQYVVIHDADVVRFSGLSGNISDLTIKQIQKVTYVYEKQFYIPTLLQLCELAQKYTKNGKAPFIAFQLKPGSDIAVGRAIAQHLKKYALQSSILFDATIEVAEQLRKEFPWVHISVSVGEDNFTETIYTVGEALSKRFTKAFDCVWADEWNIPGKIYNKETFIKFRKAYPRPGRIDVISPELHYILFAGQSPHPMAGNLKQLQKIWQEIISWGSIDGICTDYPSKLLHTI